MRSRKIIILSILMLDPYKTPPSHQERAISYTVFDFREGVTIIDFISNMKLYVSDIVK